MKKTILDHIAPRKGILAGCVFVFLLLCILRAQDTKSKAKAAVSYPQEISKITFVVAGDVIPHQSVVEAAAAQEKAQTPKVVQPSAPAEPVADAKDNAAAQTAPAQSASTDDHGGRGPLFFHVGALFRHTDFVFVYLLNPVAPKHSHATKTFFFT